MRLLTHNLLQCRLVLFHSDRTGLCQATAYNQHDIVHERKQPTAHRHQVMSHLLLLPMPGNKKGVQKGFPLIIQATAMKYEDAFPRHSCSLDGRSEET